MAVTRTASSPAAERVAGRVDEAVRRAVNSPLDRCRWDRSRRERQPDRGQARSVGQGRLVGQCGRGGLRVGEDRGERGEEVERLADQRGGVGDPVELLRRTMVGAVLTLPGSVTAAVGAEMTVSL